MADTDLKGIKVGVLGGGVSAEREVSLASAECVYRALRKRKIEAVFIDLADHEKRTVARLLLSHNIDLAFVALHGEFGEDGKLQEILEELDLPYTGSLPLASYLAMDKIASKKIFARSGIPTPNFCVWERSNYLAGKGKGTLARLPKGIVYPLVVKPYFSGSSIAVSVVRNEAGLAPALRNVFRLQDKAILESYIEGREFTVGIFEEKPLAVAEIVSKNEYFDFHAKYTEGGANLIAPADLEEGLYKKVQDLGVKAHCALGCRHFSRVDIRLDKLNFPYLLEVNSIPGFTSHSLFPLSARCSGISFDQLVIKMVSLALNDKSKNMQELHTKIYK